MTFLKLLRSIPPDGEITPELEWKLKRAAGALLRGQESGTYDLPDTDRVEVGYGEYDALEDLSEPDMIERESELSRSDFEAECDYFPEDFSEPETIELESEAGSRHVLIVYDYHTEQEIAIKEGTKADLARISAWLDLIRARDGLGAYRTEVRKMRAEYLRRFHGGRKNRRC
jgi:hypothetical protein